MGFGCPTQQCFHSTIVHSPSHNNNKKNNDYSALKYINPQSDQFCNQGTSSGFRTWGVNQPLGVPSSSVPSHSVPFPHLSPSTLPYPLLDQQCVYWCTHCFAWGRRELTVRVWSQNCGNVTVLRVLGGCKNITVCNANANSPEAAKFQKSIFSTLKCRPLHSAARGVCPLRPLPPPLTTTSLLQRVRLYCLM